MNVRETPPPGNRPVSQAQPSPIKDLGSTSSRGWGALLSGVNGARSLILAGGVALHAINVYITTTILPSVVQDIGGLDFYAWNTSVFVIASILGSAFSATLLEGMGPRISYTLAAVMFALGSLMCAAAPSMPIMLIGRFVQGIGGGLLFALAYTMIRVAFDEALWPRAMAMVSGMWGIATLVGPAVGDSSPNSVCGERRFGHWRHSPRCLACWRQSFCRPAARLPAGVRSCRSCS